MNRQAKQYLMDHYRYRIELHAHSYPGSKCSEISPKEIVKQYTQHGYDAVVLTNHFLYEYFEGLTKEEAITQYYQDYNEMCELGESSGLKILLGAEIRFTENMNDYLIYGVDREVLGRVYDYFAQGVVTFRKEVCFPKSVFIQAHPFREPCVPVAAQLLDGIEVFNLHPGHNSRIALAACYAKENNISMITAGSDLHYLKKGHSGASAMLTAVLPRDSFELATLFKSGDYILEIGNCIILP